MITFIAMRNDNAEKERQNIILNQLFIRVENTKGSTSTSIVFSPGIYIQIWLVQSCLNAEVTVPVCLNSVHRTIILKVTLEHYRDHTCTNNWT